MTLNAPMFSYAKFVSLKQRKQLVLGIIWDRTSLVLHSASLVGRLSLGSICLLHWRGEGGGVLS